MASRGACESLARNSTNRGRRTSQGFNLGEVD